MKAIVYAGVRGARADEDRNPEFERTDDMIVRVASTAICGADLHMIRAGKFAAAGVITHALPLRAAVRGHEISDKKPEGRIKVAFKP